MTKSVIKSSKETNAPAALNWVCRGLFVSLAVLILWKSLEPFYGVPGSQYTDKVQHFIAYLALGSLGLLCRLRVRSLWLLMAVLIYSAAIELLQGTMGMGRTASWGDFLANLLGILAAWAVWRGGHILWHKNVKKNR